MIEENDELLHEVGDDPASRATREDVAARGASLAAISKALRP